MVPPSLIGFQPTLTYDYTLEKLAVNHILIILNSFLFIIILFLVVLLAN